MFNIYNKNNLGKYSNEKYYFRDKIKFQQLPEELESCEELWYIIKLFRIGNPTLIKDNNSKRFTILKPNFLEELLHNLDLSLGGKFLGIDFNETERKTFLQNGITEEAISSSQLEGALTSSKVAKDMITKGRKAIGKDEKMILNNYHAMQFVNDKDFLKQDLSLESLIELQSILTKGTLDEKDQEGRLRKNSDEIIIQNGEGTQILHTPPEENILIGELQKLLNYANDKDNTFTHPFIKAVLLHFWIGYLHPFCDGNGRTARIIFYWYLLKKGYWGFSYIPISTLIKKSRIQYKNAYLYSEQDDNDLTYFLVYIANKTKLAFTDFEEYTEKKKKKQKDIFSELNYLQLNDRQNKLIIYFLDNPKNYTNNSIHKNYYGIAIDTAQRDLEKLLEKGFLTKIKQGKYVNYFPVPNLSELI
ncbi:MAG: Fic family protein [Candidatus Gracilibacteria bacterium]|nr:Fic family protein [Candidatus Gracilibacteria bacterium]